MLRSVDLPEPEGPRMATTSPMRHIEADVAQHLETAAIGRRKMFGNILKRDGRTAATIGHPRRRRLGEIDVGFARHRR